MRGATGADSPDLGWRGLYLAGAIVAIAALGGMLFDIVLSSMPGWGPASVPVLPGEWLAQFAANPLLGMRNLDLLNIVISLVTLPMYAALFGAHRRVEPGLALLALVFAAAGAVLFVANNAALPMLDLGRRYAAAGPAQRTSLEAAAAALLARGAHGSFGAFFGFLVSEIGTLLFALVMLRGRVFARATGWAGLLGAGLLTVYSVAATFGPGSTTSALMTGLAIPGGLLMIAWQVMVAAALLRLAHGRAPSRVPATAAPAAP